MSEFNYHVYLISYEDSLDGPIKIGYSHHPPIRLYFKIYIDNKNLF